jgi:hypothetical protein
VPLKARLDQFAGGTGRTLNAAAALLLTDALDRRDRPAAGSPVHRLLGELEHDLSVALAKVQAAR